MDLASLLFGAPVKPEHIIGETLRRTTEERDPEHPGFVADLKKRIESQAPVPDTYEAFRKDLLSIWIESTFGLGKDPTTGRLIRATPRSITGEGGAARDLSKLTGLAEDLCSAAIATRRSPRGPRSRRSC